MVRGFAGQQSGSLTRRVSSHFDGDYSLQAQDTRYKDVEEVVILYPLPFQRAEARGLAGIPAFAVTCYLVTIMHCPPRLINTAAYSTGLGTPKTSGTSLLELSTELQVTSKLLVIPYKEIFTTYNKNSLHHYTL